MNVIAFRPRSSRGPARTIIEQGTVTGTFLSPRGRSGRMSGRVRVQRLVLVPRGAFLTGVFTGELRDDDGSLIGVDTRRATVPADLVPEEGGSVLGRDHVRSTSWG